MCGILIGSNHFYIFLGGLSIFMFNRRVIAIIVLSCCFFESIGKNMHDRKIDENLGKPVFSFVETLNGVTVEQFCYTTELSRILLVGEHRVFEFVRHLPIIRVISLAGPLFDNRFENFIKNVEKSSQRQLQEAIEDAILLSTYNTKAYSVSKLLNYLVEALQNKIVYIRDQIKHDFKWDQKSFRSMKKSVAWAIGLMACVVITNKYITHGDENIANKVSSLEFLNAVATLGLLPVSYQVMKNCYKILTINPNACNQYLDKYEELLAFVQKLKAQLETNGFITFKLTNGRIATLKDNKLIFN